MLICLELEKRLRDLLSELVIKLELTIWAHKLIENLSVLVDLPLGREDFHANDLILDGDLELFAFLLSVDDLTELEGTFFEQVLHEAVVELLLDFLEQGRPVRLLHGLASPVQLYVFAELLEQLQHVLPCLVLHSTQEKRLHHLVVDLNVVSLGAEQQEADGIFLKTLAALQKEYELLESVLVHLISVLQQIFHG